MNKQEIAEKICCRIPPSLGKENEDAQGRSHFLETWTRAQIPCACCACSHQGEDAFVPVSTRQQLLFNGGRQGMA